MKTLFITAILLVFIPFSAVQAQNPTVLFEKDKLVFDGGNPLPAQQNFILTGNIASEITKVEAIFYKNANMDQPDFSFSWLRDTKENKNLFSIPISQMLRSNQKVTVVMNYYIPVSKDEQLNIAEILNTALSQYVDVQARINRQHLSFSKSPENMLTDMNSVVASAFKNYDLVCFQFSDIVKDKIKQIEMLKIQVQPEDLKNAKALTELKTQLISEVKAFIPTKFNKILYQYIVKDYPTQPLPRVIALNFGYGATYLGNDDYGHAPYAGIAVPLGNMKFAPFMSKMSLAAGIFLTDFNGKNNVKYTGPAIGKPIYLGAGYKLHPFISLNAGIVTTQNSDISFSNLHFNDIEISAFVGISMNLNVWFGLGNERPAH